MSSSKGESAENHLTAERLREILHYDPETGVFTRLVSGGGVKAGAVSGHENNRGYSRIGVNGRDYLAHRLAWLYVHGCWPSDQVDHINGVRSDNRIVNLREATNAENQQNLAMRPRNTSGFPGVSWHRAAGKWQAKINANRKLRHLGYFSDPAEAHASYIAAKAEYHTFNPTVRGEA